MSFAFFCSALAEFLCVGERSVVSTNQNRWPRLLGGINVGLGIAFFLGYWVYLPMPERFITADNPDPGMILYALATAGGAFVAWGLMLRSATGSTIARASLFRASAVGFALLGLMRVGTALFPHGPFAHMVALPAVECVTFLLLAWGLYKSA